MATVLAEPLKLFMHNVGLVNDTLIIGKLTTVIVFTAVFVQVDCSPMIEYVTVVVGLTVTLAPVVELIAVFGIHVYEVAPLPVKVIFPPIQRLGEIGVMLTIGFCTTVAVPF